MKNKMNPLAGQLNTAIEQTNPHTYAVLSSLGKAMYYPKGILSQSAEAKEQAHRFNATIGIAIEGGQPMHLDLIQDTLSDYSPADLYPYAAPEGKAALRKAWKEKMLIENPSLDGKKIGMPVVTNALTHGLSIVADLFVDAGDPLVLPDKLWGNYNLTFGIRRGAKNATFPLYNEEGRFNSAGFRETLLAQKEHGKAIVLLNFPNNPTGYTPGEREAEEIVAAIYDAAEAGINLVVMTDDAYFKLFFEDSIHESLFGRLANLHPRVLAIKIDGATKEEFVWGFRVGFITFASESEEILHALEQKTKGVIRGTISSCSHPSQTFVLRAIQSPEFAEQQREKYEILKGRANKVKAVLDSGKYDDAWTYYPFNSGYFMCLQLKTVDAEKLRLHLLEAYGVGTISINSTDLRIAFSCVEESDLEELFELVYQGVKDLERE
jgi:aspartate/methionine/tyrosine aminotransferase